MTDEAGAAQGLAPWVRGVIWAYSVLLIAGVVLMVLGLSSDEAENREFMDDLQRQVLAGALQSAVGRLEAFLFEMDEAVLQAAPVKGTIAPDGAIARTLRTALEGALAGEKAPEFASAAVYQDIDADEVEVPFVRLATAAGDGAPPLGAIPEAVLWDELAHADSTGGTTSLVWFSPDEGGGVRLHLVSTAMHEDTATQSARLRLLHVSAPFNNRMFHALVVHCDIVEGALATNLPHVVLHGDAEDAQIEVLRPVDTPRLRWPAKDVARGRARVAPMFSRTPFWQRFLLAIGIGAVVGGLLSLGRRALIAWGARRQVSAANPDAASSPAPEDPPAPSPGP